MINDLCAERDAKSPPPCGKPEVHDYWTQHWPHPWPCPACSAKEERDSTYERLERLKVEADRWLAAVVNSNGEGHLVAEASNGLRDLIEQASWVRR
jgi:hypothetical protein